MEFNWNYVWAALVVNFVIVYFVPRLVKKPTGIQVIDDIVLYLNSQKGFLIASSIVLVVIMYASHYWVDSQESSGGLAKSPEKY